MSIVFIKTSANCVGAADAVAESEEQGEFAVSGLFVGDVWEDAFRIGNTGSSTTNVELSSSGLNASINDDVEFSDDLGNSWETTITINGLTPNEISEAIKVRYSPPEGEILGPGSFLIRAEEV